MQICEYNWIRISVGVKKAGNRRMTKLGIEVGVRNSFVKKLVRSRVKWAGHVENWR